MKLNRKLLLTGASVLAISVAASNMAMAADEFSVGTDGTYDTNSVWATGIVGQNGNGGATAAAQGDAVTVNASGAILVNDADQIGAVTVAAGGAVLTLALDQAAGVDSTNAVTLTTVTGTAATTGNKLDLILSGHTAPTNNAAMTVTVSGAVNLVNAVNDATGDLTVAGSSTGTGAAARRHNTTANFSSTIAVHDFIVSGAIGRAGTAGTGGDAGAAGVAAATAGGSATSTVTGAATIGNDLSVAAGTGGVGGAGGDGVNTEAAGQIGGAGSAGGASSLTFASTVTITGATLVSGGLGATGGAGGTTNGDSAGGAGGTGGAGGASTLIFQGNVTSASTLGITGGAAGATGTANDGGGGAGGAGGAASVELRGNATFTGVTLTAGGGGATLLVSGTGAQTITGAITAAGGGEGTLTVTNTSTGGATFVNGVGGTALLALNVGSGATSGRATFQDAVQAQTITIGHATDYSGTATFAGTVTAATALNINALGTASFGGAVNSTTATTVRGTMRLTSNVTHTGASVTVNGGTVDLASHTLTTAGTPSLTLTGNATINLTIGSATDGSNSGLIVLGGAGVLAAGDNNITVVPTLSNRIIQTGNRVVVVDGQGDATGTGGTLTATSTGLVNWTLKFAEAADATAGDINGIGITTDRDLILVATVREASTVAGVDTQNAPSLNALNGYTGTNADLVALGTAVQNLTNGAEINRVGAQLQTTSTAAAAVASSNTVVTQVLGTVGTRTGEIRTASLSGISGVAAGETFSGLEVWMKGYGTAGTQNRRNNVDGFDLGAWGLALGADTQVASNVRMGLAYAYTDSQVKNRDLTSGNRTDVASHTGTLYGTYIGAPWYVDGMVSYTRHNYKSHRVVTVGGLNLTPKGSYNGNQWTARAEVGHPLAVSSDSTVTPFVRTVYTHLNTSSYAETGGAGANLTVNSRNMNTWQLGIGGRFNADLDAGNGGRLLPELRAYYGYDAVSSRAQSTQAFTAGGAGWTSNGPRPARHNVNLGASLGYATGGGVTVSADYDADLRSGYVGHTGALNLRIAF